MDNDPKQTNDAGNNPIGDSNASIEAFLADIDKEHDLLNQICKKIKLLEKIAEMNWDDELEKLAERYPSLDRWQLFLIKKMPKFASEFLPNYLKTYGEFAKAAEKIEDRNNRIIDIVTESYNGKEWADLLSEYPEFADKCDWAKLSDEDWTTLLEKQPQFADKRGK